MELFNLVGGLYHFGRSVSDLARAFRLMGEGAYDRLHAITAAQIATGKSEFISIGCGNCHSPSLTTAQSSFDPAMSHVTFHPYSDIAVHHMGTGLSDGVAQGLAVGDQFRSAPLWGVGQRLFFLHDGRTTDIVAAIEAHAGSGSEANAVITSFNTLSTANQQAVVDFLRSL